MIKEQKITDNRYVYTNIENLNFWIGVLITENNISLLSEHYYNS